VAMPAGPAPATMTSYMRGMSYQVAEIGARGAGGSSGFGSPPPDLPRGGPRGRRSDVAPCLVAATAGSSPAPSAARGRLGGGAANPDDLAPTVDDYSFASTWPLTTKSMLPIGTGSPLFTTQPVDVIRLNGVWVARAKFEKACWALASSGTTTWPLKPGACMGMVASFWAPDIEVLVTLAGATYRSIGGVVTFIMLST